MSRGGKPQPDPVEMRINTFAQEIAAPRASSLCSDPTRSMGRGGSMARRRSRRRIWREGFD